MEKETLNLFINLKSVVPKETDWETLYKTLRSGVYASITDQYRAICKDLETAEKINDSERSKTLKKLKSELKCKQPAVAFSVRLKGARNVNAIQYFTGYFMVDVDDLDPSSLKKALDLVEADSHTILAYTTISGYGLRVVSGVNFEVNKHNFTVTWSAINSYFSKLIGIGIDEKCKNPTRISVICHDPNAYFNPSAVRFSDMDLREFYDNRRKKSGRPTSALKAEKVVRSLVEKEGVSYEEHNHNNYISRCLYWMNRFGVMLDDATSWAVNCFADYDSNSIISTAKSCYANTNEFATRSLSEFDQKRGNACSAKKMASLKQVEAYIREHFDIRYNEVLHIVEIRALDEDVWRRITDIMENTLWRGMLHSGIYTDIFQLRLLLCSDFAQSYHPVTEYLDSLEPWDGQTDFIAEMASHVKVKNCEQKTFVENFRRWFVAMIAGAIKCNSVNQTIFVLIGKQGCYKTSFMQNILPPQLRRYYATKLNSNNFSKDDKLALTEYLLINIEEIDTMRPQDLSQLKAMTTVAYVDERPAYGRNREHRPHIASLCATGNNPYFLTDDTGNRRWLVFEVDSIDNPWETSIDYEGLYAQAYALLKNGYRYWFNSREVKEINRRNHMFETPNMARELILAYYRKPYEGERSLKITASQIVARFGGSVKINAGQVGRALKDLKFSYKHTHFGNYWLMVERSYDETRNIMPTPIEPEY